MQLLFIIILICFAIAIILIGIDKYQHRNEVKPARIKNTKLENAASVILFIPIIFFVIFFLFTSFVERTPYKVIYYPKETPVEFLLNKPASGKLYIHYYDEDEYMLVLAKAKNVPEELDIPYDYYLFVPRANADKLVLENTYIKPFENPPKRLDMTSPEALDVIEDGIRLLYNNDTDD